MNSPGFNAEREADETAEKALDDLDGLELLSDPEFADWAMEVAYEERDWLDDCQMYRELAQGLG